MELLDKEAAVINMA